ncbi:MAG: GNAT family N-acetyltransferase [Coriobacteriales bacterium]|jgi:predicted N-acetyltransferase YhbS|nr:GNAT family N-acetyltransferase [Coriobacteriales bacterium]
MSSLFTLRPAQQRDSKYLQAICAQTDLGSPPDFANTTVAVNAENIPVGFIRIACIDDETTAANGAYIYPVAVFENWQRHGVGQALVAHELAQRGALKLVACKPSRGFYKKGGFAPLAWSAVARQIAHDCEICPKAADCHPQPYIKVADKTES